MKNFIISYGDSVFNNHMSTSILNDVINKIKSDPTIEELVKNVRSISDKKKRNEYKTSHLPFSNLGTFTDNKRLTQNFISSEFMIVRIDNLDDQQKKEVKQKLGNDNRVYMYFVSPSGNGYKVVYRFSEPIIGKYCHSCGVEAETSIPQPFCANCQELNRLDNSSN